MAVYELRREFSLKLLFQVANLKKSTYHYHVQKLNRPDKYEKIKDAIQRIYTQAKGLYGYRRMVFALKKENIHLNHKTVRRLMTELKLKGLRKQKKYSSHRGEVGQIAPNLIQRNFEAAQPNEVWLTDVTEFKVNGKKLYLSAFLDVFNREIVGYEITQNPNFQLIERSFNNSIQHLKYNKNSHPIIHSDQGWLYQIPRFRSMISTFEMTQSMSRKGNCYDNALMESFFGILKNECIYREKFQNIHQAKQSIDNYIQFYNQTRIKEKFNGMSPVEYRLAKQKTA